MIIFGTRSSASKYQELPSNVCGNCSQNKMRCFSVFKYFHIYWIPLIPIGSTKYTECGHCKQVLSEESIKKSAVAASYVFPKFKRPIFHYVAPVGIAIAVCFISIFGDKHHSTFENAKSIKSKPVQVQVAKPPVNAPVPM